jgi:hypothetical protein
MTPMPMDSRFVLFYDFDFNAGISKIIKNHFPALKTRNV